MRTIQGALIFSLSLVLCSAHAANDKNKKPAGPAAAKTASVVYDVTGMT